MKDLRRKSHSLRRGIFAIVSGSDPPAEPREDRDLRHQLVISCDGSGRFRRSNPSYMFKMEVLLALQVIPVQFALLMHALAESLQFAHRSVPGRSQRSNIAAASTALSCAWEGDITTIMTRTTTATRWTFNIRI